MRASLLSVLYIRTINVLFRIRHVLIDMKPTVYEDTSPNYTTDGTCLDCILTIAVSVISNAFLFVQSYLSFHHVLRLKQKINFLLGSFSI